MRPPSPSPKLGSERQRRVRCSRASVLLLTVISFGFPAYLFHSGLLDEDASRKRRQVAESPSPSPPPGAGGRGSRQIEDLEATVASLMAQLKEMRSGLQSVRTSVGLQKDALQRQKDALAASRSSQRRLELEVMALEQPWLGHAGEVQCATDSRCTNYIDAGDKSLGAASSVAACGAYCNRTYSAPFFAFHNEVGMTLFLDHPKGRCRCYDSTPCELSPDGGYNLWSTVDSCIGVPKVKAVPETPPTQMSLSTNRTALRNAAAAAGLRVRGKRLTTEFSA